MATVSGTYDGLFDINDTDLVAAGFDPADGTITIDASYVGDAPAANNFGVYNNLTLIGNTGLSDRGYVQGAGTGLSDTLSTYTLDLTTNGVLSALQDAVDEGTYASLRFIVNRSGSTSGEYTLDNVAIAVPEPASLVLFGLGATAILGRRRK